MTRLILSLRLVPSLLKMARECEAAQPGVARALRSVAIHGADA